MGISIMVPPKVVLLVIIAVSPVLRQLQKTHAQVAIINQFPKEKQIYQIQFRNVLAN
jgi:hypothetical protein